MYIYSRPNARPSLTVSQKFELNFVPKPSFITPDFYKTLIRVGEALLDAYPYPKPTRLELEHDMDSIAKVKWYAADHILDAYTNAVRIYLRWLEPLLKSTGPFLRPVDQFPGFSNVIFQMMEAFRTNTLQNIIGYGLPAHMRKNAERETAKLGRKDLVWPQDHPDQTNLAARYLKDTPILPLFNFSLPFTPLTEQSRFRHHWILGHTGTGKTTYMRHLIAHDLRSVQRGEASLLVMDSKSLVRELRNLDLGTSTIIVDPSYVPALNPYHLANQQAAVDVLVYMFGTLLETTDMQEGVVEQIVHAVSYAPTPNLDAIRDFLTLDPKKVKPDYFAKFDEDTAFWYLHVYPSIHPATRQGILQRFVSLRRRTMIRDMLNAPSCALDLFALLHEGGTVLLVDTDKKTLGDQGTQALGRLIIALIEQASTERTHLPAREMKPIWVYIDEAADYIRNDLKFAAILDKARASKIGVTVADQYEGHIEDRRVRNALENVGIKTTLSVPGKASIRIGVENMEVSFLDYNFGDWGRLSDAQYQDLRVTIASRFGTTPRTHDPNSDEGLAEGY